MSTSQKHKSFVSEPIGDKSVTSLAGIGPVLGGRLANQGYDKAYGVVGQYLAMGKDEARFMMWLHDVSGANAKQQRDCLTCVTDWTNSYI